MRDCQSNPDGERWQCVGLSVKPGGEGGSVRDCQSNPDGERSQCEGLSIKSRWGKVAVCGTVNQIPMGEGRSVWDCQSTQAGEKSQLRLAMKSVWQSTGIHL